MSLTFSFTNQTSGSDTSHSSTSARTVDRCGLCRTRRTSVPSVWASVKLHRLRGAKLDFPLSVSVSHHCEMKLFPCLSSSTTSSFSLTHTDHWDCATAEVWSLASAQNHETHFHSTRLLFWKLPCTWWVVCNIMRIKLWFSLFQILLIQKQYLFESVFTLDLSLFPLALYFTLSELSVSLSSPSAVQALRTLTFVSIFCFLFSFLPCPYSKHLHTLWKEKHDE